VIVLETRTARQLSDDIEHLGGLVAEAGALDLYQLPMRAAHDLIEARERAFWVAKAAGAHDVVDIVVPRSCVPGFLRDVLAMAERHESFVAGLRPRR
jgi:glycolate oxidase